MGNAGSVRHVFIEAFTPYGKISLLEELLSEVNVTYYFSGGIGTGKSTMIKLIGIQLIDRGYEVDYIRSVKEPDSVAGLFLRRHRLVVLDRDEFMPGTTKEGLYNQTTDFCAFCDQTILRISQERRNSLERKLSQLEEEIVQALRSTCLPEERTQLDTKQEEAKDISGFLSLKNFLCPEGKERDHPDLHEIADILTRIKKNHLSYLFLHGLQIDGWVNLAPHFIRDYDRICLEREDASGLLRDLLQEVRCLGQDMELILHPLKPYTVAGIVFPEKKLTVWRGNPIRIQEQGLQKPHPQNLQRLLESYRTTRAQLKAFYNEAVSFRGLDDLREDLISSIIIHLSEEVQKES